MNQLQELIQAHDVMEFLRSDEKREIQYIEDYFEFYNQLASGINKILEFS